MYRFFLFAAILSSAFSGYAGAQEKQNLLTRSDLVFLPDQSTGLTFDNTLQIKDENLETSARISLAADIPTELVFSFSESTVTPTSLKVFVAGLEKDQASVEILVSEEGPDLGYLSLRAEPLNADGMWQRFAFEPAAAKWLMVKFAAYGQSSDFELKEIAVEGYDGPPVSLYAFNEAPSEAIDVIKGLEQVDLAFNIHPDERALLEDAVDGQLDDFSFAEASLISSGIHEAGQRTLFLEQLEALTDEARSVTANKESAFEKGRILLEWMHEDAMRDGYSEAQTDISGVLDARIFNCVSSATLYNIIARRLGLDARGIEVPDHAFSILYDGTRHVDVETTTPQGFDPARNRAAMNAFSRTTGYTYISDKHRGKRRELDDAGMIALTYYNHGVTASLKDDFSTALLFYFKALSLDPRNKSAIKNTLAVLGRWSLQEIDDQDYQRAVKVLDAALSFAPADRSSRHNMRFALSKAMIAARSVDETARLAAFAQDLYSRTDDKSFLRLQSRALQSKAYDFVQQGNYEGAIALTETLDSNTDDTTRRDIERLRISLYLNWSSAALDVGNFSVAMDVLERALLERPSDHRVKNNIAFTTQEWAASVSATEGTKQSQELLLKLSARFPELKRLQRISARNYDIDARAAFDAGNYEGAIEIYQAAQQLGINKSSMGQNEKIVWNKWGLSRMDIGDFQGALAIYEKALAAHPGYSKFTNNVAYIVQEWGKSMASEGRILEAERIIATQSERFEEISAISRLQGNFISGQVDSARTGAEFEALAPTLMQVSEFAGRISRFDNLVGFFYQNWAKSADPEFANDEALTILQSGVDNYPENSQVEKLFVYAVNRLGDEAINNADWKRAMTLFQSASRSLPDERTFIRKLKIASEKI